MSVSLYQIHSATPIQMMSYVVKTENGRLIVIDGGNKGDGESLLSFLYELCLGEKPVIDMWFLTHNHTDHVDAFSDIMLNSSERITVKNVCCKMIDRDFFLSLPDDGAYGGYELDRAFEILGQDKVITPCVNDVFTIDNVCFEILYVTEDKFAHNYMNNSSMVMMMYAEGQKTLFLGDLGVEGGERVLEMHPEEKLKCDFVQMAHHGQNGVAQSFYKAVSPKGCLWPTPKWLWDNDAGLGYNTHTFATVITRSWMDELGVKTHFKEYEGTQKIVLPFDFDAK